MRRLENSFLCLRPIGALVFALMVAAVASACNIPVFRFALERWQPDACELIIFTDRELTSADQRLLEELEAASGGKGGNSNLAVVRYEVQAEMPKDIDSLWQTAKEIPGTTLPFAVARSVRGKDKTINGWSGSLAELREASLLTSPARQELIRRLQGGDAVVWLVLQSKNDAANQAVMDLLQKQCEKLPAELELPEGIGLPGSELYSEVPLLLQFSVMTLNAADPQERYLVRQLTGFQPDAWASGQPLIVPVFGRGRALEVIPASELSAELMHDLTEFLCGACSCQVKEQNPGFDLLLSTNWNVALFGEEAELPPPAPTVGEGQKKTPQLVPIPSGRKKP